VIEFLSMKDALKIYHSAVVVALKNRWLLLLPLILMMYSFVERHLSYYWFLAHSKYAYFELRNAGFSLTGSILNNLDALKSYWPSLAIQSFVESFSLFLPGRLASPVVSLFSSLAILAVAAFWFYIVRKSWKNFFGVTVIVFGAALLASIVYFFVAFRLDLNAFLMCDSSNPVLLPFLVVHSAFSLIFSAWFLGILYSVTSSALIGQKPSLSHALSAAQDKFSGMLFIIVVFFAFEFALLIGMTVEAAGATAILLKALMVLAVLLTVLGFLLPAIVFLEHSTIRAAILKTAALWRSKWRSISAFLAVSLIVGWAGGSLLSIITFIFSENFIMLVQTPVVYYFIQLLLLILNFILSLIVFVAIFVFAKRLVSKA